jgi:hypothetical protein
MKAASTARSGSGWSFWVGWALAFVGFPLGGVAAAALVGPITTPLSGAIGGAVTGAVLGAVEWLALRRWLALSPWWIAATALGMGSGLALSITLLGTSTDGAALPLRGLITGAGIGIAQFVLLRSISSRAPVWALIVALGWALGWMITRAAGIDLALQWSAFGSSGALTFQLLTGLTLAWMLRRDKVTPHPAAERHDSQFNHQGDQHPRAECDA